MREHVVVTVAYDHAELLDIACVTTAFAMAGQLGARTPYRQVIATPGGRSIALHSGLALTGQQPLERLTGPVHTLIVSGGLGHEQAAADARLVGHVRRLAKESRRVASVCTGAHVLAAAGLLDGKRATTHWGFAAQLAARYPQVTVDPAPIYIRDGGVCTAAGVTSALDMTLAFIEEDHGPEVARTVSRHLVTYLQRPGNQAQMSIFTAPPPPGDHLVRRIADHVASNLDGDLSSAGLAAYAGVSERHLNRLFTEHIGQTPGRYVRRVRTEAAANLLTSTGLPLTAVARRCGFGSSETLRLAFAQRYGVSPAHFRATQTTTG
ncbi:MAG: helix-turn-helix domain-containing protein [Hamadaea sp.]|uniref:GlxA family transcriptional regulator n=1 Tax=Hamadaea sp. TaxID=2024425 RepID=UPI0018155244|nr:helix-turn-helix domain-containing protein [Hamadaea sp.]NUR69475.1 helix-turn-helix domain-containing protein [Hamadaea sp.]NUT20711.1 helix-turn-helix domain-containing protein [Hamadaea sp.]